MSYKLIRSWKGIHKFKSPTLTKYNACRLPYHPFTTPLLPIYHLFVACLQYVRAVIHHSQMNGLIDRRWPLTGLFRSVDFRFRFLPTGLWPLISDLIFGNFDLANNGMVILVNVFWTCFASLQNIKTSKQCTHSQINYYHKLIN